MAATAPQSPLLPEDIEVLASLDAQRAAQVLAMVGRLLEHCDRRLEQRLQEQREWLAREFDRREQYAAAAKDLLAPAPTEEMGAAEAARRLGYASANTMLKRLYRDCDPELAGCVISRDPWRFSRSRVEALRTRRAAK